MVFALRTASLAALALVLVGDLGRASTPPADPPPPEPIVDFRDGRLSVVAADVPPMALLERIAELTGAHVSGTVDEPATVTVSFRDVPVRQAIDRIVGDTNFMLRYGSDGSLRRITLRGRALPRGPAPRAAGRRPRVRFQRAWLGHPPVPVPSALAQALGQARMPLPLLLRSVRKLESPALRRQAVATFVRSVERDAALRAAWDEMAAPELATLVTQQTGPRARETLRHLAGATRHPATRSRATAALAVLPDGRPAAR